MKIIKPILKCPCCVVDSIYHAKNLLIEIVEHNDICSYAVAINAEKIIRYQKDAILKQLIDNSVFPSPDGAGAVIGLKFLWGLNSIKLDLPELLLEIANERGWKIFLAGSTEEVNRLAKEHIQVKYPNIIISGRKNGYCTEHELFTAINSVVSQVIFLSLGSPKQEYVASSFATRMASGFIVGTGGALDVMAGLVDRAPNFMINNNLEWLYRLYKNPGRWRRQLVLPKFFVMLAWNALLRKI